MTVQELQELNRCLNIKVRMIVDDVNRWRFSDDVCLCHHDIINIIRNNKVFFSLFEYSFKNPKKDECEYIKIESECYTIEVEQQIETEIVEQILQKLDDEFKKIELYELMGSN